MARTHVWKFLVNQAGEPIENANIYITMAGGGGIETGEPAWVYFDEFSEGGSRSVPQVSTLENGYFEFWIDENEDFDPDGTIDNSEAQSYGYSQKFRLDWLKAGISQGYVDYIDVFPASRFFEKVDETDETSTYKNKVISNYLGWKWDTHADQDAREDNALPIHGFELVRPTEPNDIPNKVITNRMGWTWDQHEQSTVENYNLSGGYHPPHGLVPYTPGSNDTEWNVVVNDWTITNLYNLISESKAGLFDIGAPDWALNVDGDYEYQLVHSLDIEFPDVTCYNSITNKMIKTAEIHYVDSNTVTITIDEIAIYMKVRVTT